MEEIAKSLLALGPGGIVGAVMWWFWREERTERRDLVSKLIQQNVESITAEKDMTAALSALAAKIRVPG